MKYDLYVNDILELAELSLRGALALAKLELSENPDARIRIEPAGMAGAMVHV